MADQATACDEAMSGKTADPLMSFPQISGRIPAPPMPTGGVFGSTDPAALFEVAVQGGEEDEEPYESDNEDSDSEIEEDDVEARSGMTMSEPVLASEQVDVDEDEELYETYDEEEDGDDSDSEFEDDDDLPPEFARDGEADGKQHPALDFVEFIRQPAWFASDESTAGFMRVAAAEAEAGQEGGSGGSEIVVHYRYTLFSRSLNGNGVAVRRRPKLHRVRFLVPSSSADTASSLRLAGAALAGLIYPGNSRKQLRALWSSLLAAVARGPATLPPMAARLDVTVDVGVLRRRDGSPDRVARMLTALPAVAWKVDEWPDLYDGGVVVMRLPAPVRCCGEEDDDGVRPAKRRRLAGGEEEEEECAICWEVMKRGLASWPRCSHVFHGQCLEELLVRGDQRCPMCRSELRIEASC